MVEAWRMLLMLLLLLLHTTHTQNSEPVTMLNKHSSNKPSINPLQALKLARHPVDSVVERGDTFTMHCTVAERLVPAAYLYSWYRFDDLSDNIQFDELSRLPYEDRPELVLYSVNGAHAGYYVCNVTMVTDGVSYTLLSDSGKLTVNFFSPPEDPMKVVKSAQEDQNFIQLECDLPPSSPRLDISWYKNWNKISDDPRMFVMPEDSTYERDVLRGSLIIMNIKISDAGRYICKTERNGETYTLCEYTLKVYGLVQTTDVVDPRLFSTVPGSSPLGGSAEFYCAGIGKPPPTITWTKEGFPIATSEKYQLEDNKRRLIVTNVDETDNHAYTCSLSVGNDRGDRMNIMYLTITAPVTQINFVTVPHGTTMETNTYPPFKLDCAIDLSAYENVDSSLNPVMYWLRNGRQVANSKRISLKTKIHSETMILESTIDFGSPNEDDIGVYQCIVKRSNELRQKAAQVTLTQGGNGYHVDQSVSASAQYQIISSPMFVDKAEERCRSWDDNAHLVSFMGEQEVKTVLELLEESGIANETLWIGLTSERMAGRWEWTQPADNSRHFSYWIPGSPDDSRENYAVMDQTMGGRWRDVRNNEERKFVCKRYDNWCPSIGVYFHGMLEPLNKVENKNSKYGVGETITVTCSDRKVTMKRTLICSRLGKYEEPDNGFPCPVYSSTSSSFPRTISHSILISLSLLLTRCCAPS